MLLNTTNMLGPIMTAPRPHFERVSGYDIAIIGAGVVGCAMARRFSLDGARVVLLEKAADVLDGASKGNSGILHTGFDAPEGSLELSCMQAGYREYIQIRERLGLPLLQTGALVLAWDDAQLAALPGLMDKARANGVDDIENLTRDEILRLEPNLSPSLLGGFRVPQEYVIDPWSAAHGYLLQAIENGTDLFCDTELLRGERQHGRWKLETNRGAIDAQIVINTAGLYGDIVDERLLGRRLFHIKPRKGQFVVYDKTAFDLAQHILLPVPSKLTKGVVVCRTAYGNLLVGPTAEEQDARDVATLDEAQLRGLMQRGEDIIPKLADEPVTAIYAGLRPASDQPEYRIEALLEDAYVSVGGIRSTGLTASLGIAQHVAGLVQGEFSPPEQIKWPQAPQICETGPRDWQRPGHDGILCHCEFVTRREIEQALAGPIAAHSLAGLKRRTRVTMGRCQGFYCSGELARITKDRLTSPMLPPFMPSGGKDG